MSMIRWRVRRMSDVLLKLFIRLIKILGGKYQTTSVCKTGSEIKNSDLRVTHKE